MSSQHNTPLDVRHGNNFAQIVLLSFSEIINCLKYTGREIAKFKFFLFLYLIIFIAATQAICFAATKVNFAWWIVAPIKAILLAYTNIFVFEKFLEKYRGIKINKTNFITRRFFMGFLWAISFGVMAILIGVCVKALYSYFASSIFEWPYGYGPFIIGWLDRIILASIMVPFSFYPFLVLEGSSKPFKASFSLTKKYRLPLAVLWVLLWVLQSWITHGVVLMIAKVMMQSQAAMPEDAAFLLATEDHFIVGAIFTILLAVMTSVVYLRAMGSPEFTRPIKVPSLLSRRH